MRDLALIHLVRAQNGVAPVERFVASYRARPAETEHDLIIVYKGFGVDGPPAAIQDLLLDIPHRELQVSDSGFDLGAYLTSAARVQHEYVCFLNSFSVILAPGWLRMLRAHLDAGAGIVGATGSWESILTDQTIGAAPRRMGLGALRRAIMTARLRSRFPPFPNPHVRTNAFALRREHLLLASRARLSSKMDAHRFESGIDGLTRRVLALGLEAVVVGRDGKGYPPEQWNRSLTFRSGRQQNLLVADNQTALFDAATAEQRTVLSRYAWGSSGEAP